VAWTERTMSAMSASRSSGTASQRRQVLECRSRFGVIGAIGPRCEGWAWNWKTLEDASDGAADAEIAFAQMGSSHLRVTYCRHIL
jgi:hypothetical protein